MESPNFIPMKQHKRSAKTGDKIEALYKKSTMSVVSIANNINTFTEKFNLKISRYYHAL